MQLNSNTRLDSKLAREIIHFKKPNLALVQKLTSESPYRTGKILKRSIGRREFIKAAGVGGVAAWFESHCAAALPLQLVGSAAIDIDGNPLPQQKVRVRLRQQGRESHPLVTNLTGDALRLREVVLWEYHHSLPPDTRVYGESFQMLTQTVGTLAAIREIGYGEQKHYRIPGPKDAAVVTNLLTLSPPGQHTLLFAYTSSRRFCGRFYLRDGSISAVVDMEGLTLQPAESIALESLLQRSGADRALLLEQLAERLNANHPHRTFQPVPMGWCSWYSFARDTTAKQVIDNLGVIQDQLPALKYIQIDDGYQPAMGDWLEPGPSFGGHVQDVLKQIRSAGLQPAIWVAPFIAATNSRVLREHPDWFVKNSDGKPMPAASVTFGGWGGGGWYCLDGTHPEVQAHLEHVFRVMREEWGCTYFKLDANFWGAVHGGRFHDPNATRIEAYRRGMEAVRRGAGEAFLLGCNHPIWPSLGLIDGSRSSGDIARRWKTVAGCMEESMQRNWQNGRLWWNDPDAVLLADRADGPMAGHLTEEEFRFHATSAYASGGMILSGDDLTTIPTARLAMLRKLMPPSGKAAIFDDASTLEIGRIRTSAALHIVLFNRDDTQKSIAVPLHGRYKIQEMWTGEDLGTHSDVLEINVPAHGGRILICKRASGGA
jgi:alpha-galactosidase